MNTKFQTRRTIFQQERKVFNYNQFRDGIIKH